MRSHEVKAIQAKYIKVKLDNSPVYVHTLLLMEIGTAGVIIGMIGLLGWCVAATSNQDTDAREWQRCSAKCNKGLVDCWDKHPGDPGNKCDEQWDACYMKCRPKPQDHSSSN